MAGDVVAVLVAEDLLRGGVEDGLARCDELISSVTAERAHAADLLHLVQRPDVRAELRELGPMGEMHEELGPGLRGDLRRERVGDANVDDLAGRGRDRATAIRDRGPSETARVDARDRVVVERERAQRGGRGRRCWFGASRSECDDRGDEQRAREQDRKTPRGRERHPALIAAGV
jgi:hypothetical protein